MLYSHFAGKQKWLEIITLSKISWILNVFSYAGTKFKYVYKILFSGLCYMNTKNVFNRANHHPSLLECVCLLFVWFCHLGQAIFQFPLSDLLVSGILAVRFLSLPLNSLFLQNLFQSIPVTEGWRRKSSSRGALAVPSFPFCLTVPTCHSAFTLQACSGETPSWCKVHTIHIFKTQCTLIYTHTIWKFRSYWFWVCWSHSLDRIPLNCSLPGYSTFSLTPQNHLQYFSRTCLLSSTHRVPCHWGPTLSPVAWSEHEVYVQWTITKWRMYNE